MSRKHRPGGKQVYTERAAVEEHPRTRAWGWEIEVWSDQSTEDESREEFCIRLDRALRAAGFSYSARTWRYTLDYIDG